jgi:hypothetical protein
MNWCKPNRHGCVILWSFGSLVSLNVDELVLDIGGLVKLWSFGMLEFWLGFHRETDWLFILGSLTSDGSFECFDYVLRPLVSRRL